MMSEHLMQLLSGPWMMLHGIQARQRTAPDAVVDDDFSSWAAWLTSVPRIGTGVGSKEPAGYGMQISRPCAPKMSLKVPAGYGIHFVAPSLNW